LREKELRIALVCFGGISLAIYMHGITKEILKLVRASSALHAVADRSQRAQASFFDRIDRNDPEYDTEDIYFELLREIGRTVEMRAIVDIIAGASAGGINGTMLARAVSHDLPMDALRDLWLENADVAILLAPDARAGVWSKWFLKPFLWAVARTGSFRAITDMEVRQKLSLFVRSRWFKPPLDGRVMAGLMYDAVTSMGAAKNPRASLLPSGQSLDLFVALTDYYGYQQLVQIHDPPLIHERDHHHILHFSYRRHSNGEVESDLGLDNAPALASWKWTRSSWKGKQAGPGARNSSPSLFQTTCAPASIRPHPRFSTARCSTTGHSSRRFRRSTAGRRFAKWIAAWFTSIPIRRLRCCRASTESPAFLPHCAARCRTSQVRSR